MSTQKIIDQLFSIQKQSTEILSRAYGLDAHLFGDRPMAATDPKPGHGSGFIGEVFTLLDQIQGNLNEAESVLENTNERLNPSVAVPSKGGYPSPPNKLFAPKVPPMPMADVSLTEADLNDKVPY